MNLAELLIDLHDRAVTVSVVGDTLRYRAPVGALTEDLRMALRTHKVDIVDLLCAAPASETAPAPTRPATGPAPVLAGARVSVVIDAEHLSDASSVPTCTPCSRCGQPRRVRCRYVGQPGVWLAWCDSDSPACRGKADIVDEEDQG
jgi:hypothetical protein